MPGLWEYPSLIHLTPLDHADPTAIETLLDLAFGADRHRRTAYRLRPHVSALPGLSFAAWEGDRLVGTLQSWPVALVADGAPHDVVMVGPVAVLPDAQGKGIGSALMDRLIAAATAPMVMIGDPDYYNRWGFVAGGAAGWRIEAGPYEQHRLLARDVEALPRTGVLSALATDRTNAPDRFRVTA